MSKFPGDFPDNCPFDADVANATLFHGCGDQTATDEDFAPFARSADEKKRQRAKRAGCNGWGISVWTTERAARHAQELFPDWMGKWHIFKGDVTPDDGQLKLTPSRNQAEHYTFWSFEGVTLRERFVRAWPPYEGAAP
jgi:hypothetical protein